MDNLSGVCSKANETKLDPFSKTGPRMVPRNHPRQPGGAGKHGPGGRRLEVTQFGSTTVEAVVDLGFFVNEGSGTQDALPMMPTLAPTMTLC